MAGFEARMLGCGRGWDGLGEQWAKGERQTRKKRSSQDSWKTCTLGTPIPQICVVSVNHSVENRAMCMVNNARKLNIFLFPFISTR
jgi:hypothetical protein